MGKKSEYRSYIQSEPWQARRRDFLSAHGTCKECGLPRYLSVLIFDEDLHVDDRNYQRLGSELDSDLQALCKQCHELKHFGHTSLADAATGTCVMCDRPTWDRFSEYHAECEASEAMDVNRIGINWDESVLRIASPPARRKMVIWLIDQLEKLSPGKNADNKIISQISEHFRNGDDGEA
jgi:hypothetical protein